MNDEKILSWINANSIMFTGLLLFGLFTLYYLYKITIDGSTKANVIDLITENDKLSERKFTRFGTWIITSWGFIYMIATCKLEEWYFYGYIGAWVSNALLAKYIPNNDMKQKVKEENS